MQDKDVLVYIKNRTKKGIVQKGKEGKENV